MNIKIIKLENLNNTFTVEEARILYNIDKSFNRLQIDKENKYNNINRPSLNKEIRNNIKQYKNNKYNIKDNNLLINIDTKTCNEYTYSNYSMKINNKLRKIKAHLSLYIKEILENSSFYKYEVNHKEKHNVDAKYGFYYYKIIFSILDKTKEEIYNGTIILRHSFNSKLYLYDIINIKQVDYKPTCYN